MDGPTGQSDADGRPRSNTERGQLHCRIEGWAQEGGARGGARQTGTDLVCLGGVAVHGAEVAAHRGEQGETGAPLVGEGQGTGPSRLDLG